MQTKREIDSLSLTMDFKYTAHLIIKVIGDTKYVVTIYYPVGVERENHRFTSCFKKLTSAMQSLVAN